MPVSPLPQGFSISEHVRDDGVTVVVVTGELDLATAPPLKEHLDALAHATTPTVLDLAAVSFLDSTGLKVIFGASREAHDSGWSFVVGREVTPEVARLFDLVGAHEIVPFAPES